MLALSFISGRCIGKESEMPSNAGILIGSALRKICRHCHARFDTADAETPLTMWSTSKLADSPILYMENLNVNVLFIELKDIKSA
jgi:hypothetical protein